MGTPYLGDEPIRREYEREIAPRTVAALEAIFARVPLPAPSRVLDLGAGTGAVGQVVRARFPEAELVAVDKVPAPGVLCADVTRGLRPARVEGRFTLIVAAHLLNELAPKLDCEARARLVMGWCRELLEEQGTCILLEPALRETSRGLLAVRDHLVAAGLFVVAPCLVQGPCPALVRERDFCHSSAETIVQGRSRVDFSYLVLRRQGVAPTDPTLFRLVSDPIKDKGRLRLFGCGPAGRLVLSRLDRDRSANNEIFGQVTRGDLVEIEGAAKTSDGLRIGHDTRMARCQP